MTSSAQNIGDVLKISVSVHTPVSEIKSFSDLCRSVGAALYVSWFIDTGLTADQEAMVMKGSIVARFERMAEVRTLGAQRGYLLPDDPLPRFKQLNSSRLPWAPLNITEAEGKALVEACVELSKIVTGYDDGTIKFDRKQPSAQLASFEISVDGMVPQSGDALVDILGYQPDIDFVKRKRALDSLARLDFSKRKPYLLFTADVIRNGRREQGTIICWARMRDASGYKIYKRDVFSLIDYPASSLSNERLTETTRDLMQTDSFAQALTFYDWLDSDDVFAYVDTQMVSNTLFSYEIEGLQRLAPATPFIFDVGMSALFLSPAQIAALAASVLVEDRSTAVNGISPYPALSQLIYGDASYGWILAGCNVLSSRRRGDNADQTRALSFLGCGIETLLAEVQAGRIVVPNDVRDVQAAVDRGVTAYGLAQTLLCVLDGTGLTLFVSGRDEMGGFQPTQQSLELASGGLSKILAAIDIESATVDSRVLVASLAGSTAAGPTSRGAPTTSTSAVSQLTATSFSRNLLAEELGTRQIDLTTYQGISEFMGIIRRIYDFYPGALT